MRTHELSTAHADAGVQRVIVGGLLLMDGHNQCFGQAARPLQLGAQLQRIQVLGIRWIVTRPTLRYGLAA